MSYDQITADAISQIAAKNAEIAALTGERDRQYEYNVAQIAKQAELEAQIAALREALAEAHKREIWLVAQRDAARAALEMSGEVK